MKHEITLSPLKQNLRNCMNSEYFSPFSSAKFFKKIEDDNVSKDFNSSSFLTNKGNDSTKKNI